MSSQTPNVDRKTTRVGDPTSAERAPARRGHAAAAAWPTSIPRRSQPLEGPRPVKPLLALRSRSPVRCLHESVGGDSWASDDAPLEVAHG